MTYSVVMVLHIPIAEQILPWARLCGYNSPLIKDRHDCRAPGTGMRYDMKPPLFDYYDPATEDEALALLAEFGAEAKILAGGQSLMPLLNMRLVEPAVVIDINRLDALSGVCEQADHLAIGALARQHRVEQAEPVRRHCPLLCEALPYVGYPQIRHRGTIGGSLAHADPSAELPAVMAVLDAEFEVRSQNGQRVLRPHMFFESYLTTALEPEELLCEIRIPYLASRTGCAFMEVARVAGAFAIVGAAALVTLDETGGCTTARVALTGVGPVPHRANATEVALQGDVLTSERIQQAAQVADTDLEPESDVHATAAYRQNLARVLTQRTLMTAWQRAMVTSR